MCLLTKKALFLCLATTSLYSQESLEHFGVWGSLTYKSHQQEHAQLAHGSFAAENTESSVIYPRPEFSPGFDIGVQCFWEEHDWNLQLQYSWFFSEQNQTFSLQKNSYPTWDIYGDGSYLQSHIQKLVYENSMHFCRTDFLFFRNFCIKDRIVLSPYWGFIHFYDSQNTKIQYFIASVKIDQTSWGTGPFVGCDLSFACIKNLEHRIDLFGHWGSSFQGTKFNARSSVVKQNKHLQNLTISDYQITYLLEAIAGFRYAYKSNKFCVESGWSIQMYTNHSHAYPVMRISESMHCNMILQGFVLKVFWGF